MIALKYFEEDRQKAEAELAACEDGSWPRDLNDRLRYDLPSYPYDPPEVVAAKHREYVAKLCRKKLAWLLANAGLSNTP